MATGTGRLLGLAAVAAAAAGAAAAETPLERGAYLVNSIVACGNCHTPRGDDGPIAAMELAGGYEIESPVFTARAPNITPDRETGIGGWTDRQIIDAIRNGRRPDGSIIGPPMPFNWYRRMADDDVRAIVAYLRRVKPVRNRVAKSEYSFPLPKSYGPTVRRVAAVPRDDKVRYGAYLAGPLGHCVECHTPIVRGRIDYTHRLGAGGQTFGLPGGGETVAANITPDPVTGIGKWRDADIRRAITEGVRPDGGALVPMMGFSYYRNIRRADLDALIAYLRSIKPVTNRVR